jgi:hypothetical protein
MYIDRNYWELIVLDGEGDHAIPGDFDGDGHTEIVNEMRWYRPATFERGDIQPDVAPRRPGATPGTPGKHDVAIGDRGLALRCVGATSGDVDGDGRPEVVGSTRRDADGAEYYVLYWYEPKGSLSEPWAAHKICDEQVGQPHDIVVADVDGDGRNEVVVVRMYIATPSVTIYKPGADITQPWQGTLVQAGTSGDGTAVADFDGDGAVEIVAGPYIYHSTPQGLLVSRWIQGQLAPGFREMGVAAAIDVTGNGTPDAVWAESEYPDCRVAWFEYGDEAWIEHPLDDGLNFVHSMDAWTDKDGAVHVFLAEMNEGGWNAGLNHDARLIEYVTTDGGATWDRRVLYKGFGTFQAAAYDVDDDGAVEIVGNPAVSGQGMYPTKHGIYVWKARPRPSFPVRYRHRFLDRNKGWTGTDILAVDVDGDGLQDVVCAAWWYKAPNWERYRIPGVAQIINACDLDADGRTELIGTKPNVTETNAQRTHLSSDLVWLKAVDPVKDEWEMYPIGTLAAGKGSHGFPHGTTIAPVLPGGGLAFIAMGSGPLELYSVPADPEALRLPWPKRVFAEAKNASSHMEPADLTGNGLLDLVAMWTWLENLGDGTFRPHVITERYDWEAENPSGFKGGEHLLADINGNGLLDIVACEEHVAWGEDPRRAYFSRLAWFEHPGDPTQGPWKMHVIDSIRSPHSLALADLDGDGELEIICGEHDPFKPYRARPKVYVYKKADPQGRAWTRHVVDDRFDNHVGTRVIQLADGKLGIISHGWMEPSYVHLWEPV